MYLVEREFNSSAQQWVAMQRTGWIAFQSPYTMTLTSSGGVRYIQACVADGVGNISLGAYKTRIDYLPASDTVAAGQVRIFRRTLDAGDTIVIPTVREKKFWPAVRDVMIVLGNVATLYLVIDQAVK